MTELQLLERHSSLLQKRTLIAMLSFSAFVLIGAVSVTKGLGLTDPLMILSVGLCFGSFLILPRDYKPASLMIRTQDEEARPILIRIDLLQKYGFVLRGVFACGALFLLGLLPRLIN